MTGRARYITHVNAFRTKAAHVPVHAFVAERARAFAPDQPTGIVPLDLSATMGTDYPLTTPGMLYRYLRIRPDEALATAFHATGTIFYVIEGSSHSEGADTRFGWSAGDAFVFPGDVASRHRAGLDSAVLYCADDEPDVRFYHVQPDPTGVAPILYAKDDVARTVEAVHARGDVADEAGKAVFLTHEQGTDHGTVTPSMVAVFTTLPPGGHQRAHGHNAAAVTLAIAGEGVQVTIEGKRAAFCLAGDGHAACRAPHDRQ